MSNFEMHTCPSDARNCPWQIRIGWLVLILNWVWSCWYFACCCSVLSILSPQTIIFLNTATTLYPQPCSRTFNMMLCPNQAMHTPWNLDIVTWHDAEIINSPPCPPPSKKPHHRPLWCQEGSQAGQRWRSVSSYAVTISSCNWEKGDIAVLRCRLSGDMEGPQSCLGLLDISRMLRGYRWWGLCLWDSGFKIQSKHQQNGVLLRISWEDREVENVLPSFLSGFCLPISTFKK